MSTRSSTSSVRCRKAARPTAYANGAPRARFRAASHARRQSSMSSAASRCIDGQNRGMSTIAATMSRASRWASGTRAPARCADSAATTSPTRAGAAVPNVGNARTSAIEPLLDVRLTKRLDQWADLALEDSRQLVHRQVDPMVGHAILRKVVGANLRGAIAGADLRLAHARALGFLLRHLEVQEARSQYLHRPCPVLNLGALILLAHDDPGRDVRDAHRRVGGVDALAARTRGAEHV